MYCIGSISRLMWNSWTALEKCGANTFLHPARLNHPQPGTWLNSERCHHQLITTSSSHALLATAPGPRPLHSLLVWRFGSSLSFNKRSQLPTCGSTRPTTSAWSQAGARWKQTLICIFFWYQLRKIRTKCAGYSTGSLWHHSSLSGLGLMLQWWLGNKIMSE